MVCFGLLLFFMGSLAATPLPGCEDPFRSLEGKWCIYVNVTVSPGKGTINPLHWAEARASCVKSNSDLVSLDDSKKLQAISKHLDENCIDETKLGWVYWVGAEGRGNNNWLWVRSDASISLHSNIWMPNQPPEAKDTTRQYGRLAPTYSTRGRRYLVSDTSDGISPGYICEKPWGF